MYEKLKNKIVLVTGGGSGIGRATALAFAREMAEVVIVDVHDGNGNETVGLIEEMRGKAVFINCDVSKATEVEALINQSVENFGRLDCAFNNAGILGEMATTADCTEDNFDRIINTNLKGVWLCMKYEILQMVKQGSGAIVNTASNAAVRGVPELPAYSASKGGILQLTRTAALETAASGIRVNAINPGLISTPMVHRQQESNPEAVEGFIKEHPVGRIGEPEEIAEAVVWLCSDAASFVTGHIMAVDGGITAK